MTERWITPGTGAVGTLEVPPSWKGDEVKNLRELKQILAWNIQNHLRDVEDEEATPEENREARFNMARAALRELHSQNLALGISASFLADGGQGAIDSMLMDDMLMDRLLSLWDLEFPLKITTEDPGEYTESLEWWAMNVTGS